MTAKRRTTRTRRLAVASAVAAGALAVAHGVAASIATQVAGNYTVTDFGAIACAPVGAAPHLFKCRTSGLISEYTGSLVGESRAEFDQLIDCARGRTHGVGSETFSGEVDGVGEGTLTWRIRFDANLDCATFSVSQFRGGGAIISGTGELAGQNGHLTFGDDTYEGTLH